MRRSLRKVPGLDKADRALGKIFWRSIGIVCWGVALIMFVSGVRIMLGPLARWDGLILVAGAVPFALIGRYCFRKDPRLTDIDGS
jgi:hypothetical protein